ncbi:cupin domain-containing protein [Yoonia sp. MH D7]
MTLIYRMTRTGDPEISRPAPEKIVSGDPVFTTWNVEDVDGLYAGIWQSTAGRWRISYDEWEYCHILEGVSVLHGSDGSRLEVKAGDSFVLRPGFVGEWEVIETTVKEYVIRV